MSKVYGKIGPLENGWKFEGIAMDQLKELIQLADNEDIDSIEETFGDLAILPAILKDLISEIEGNK